VAATGPRHTFRWGPALRRQPTERKRFVRYRTGAWADLSKRKSRRKELLEGLVGGLLRYYRSVSLINALRYRAALPKPMCDYRAGGAPLLPLSVLSKSRSAAKAARSATMAARTQRATEQRSLPITQQSGSRVLSISRDGRGAQTSRHCCDDLAAWAGRARELPRHRVTGSAAART
jgi:hypothetical protein